jgi:uncharacterized protein
MKRIIIVHGWSGSPNDNWLPWIKSELEILGHEVLTPAMPDTDNPAIEKWVNCLSETVRTPDLNTFFIGHSIGCQAILRYLETIDTSVGGAMFVSGWFNLENMENKEEEKIAEPWIKTAIDIEKIKAILPKSLLIISDNDPYGAFKENIEKFSAIMTQVIVLHNAEHITEQKEPAVLSHFLEFVK